MNTINEYFQRVITWGRNQWERDPKQFLIICCIAVVVAGLWLLA